MSFDHAAFAARQHEIRTALDAASEAGDVPAVLRIGLEMTCMVMDAQVEIAETFAAALVDHEKRLIAIEAGLQGTA